MKNLDVVDRSEVHSGLLLQALTFIYPAVIWFTVLVCMKDLS